MTPKEITTFSFIVDYFLKNNYVPDKKTILQQMEISPQQSWNRIDSLIKQGHLVTTGYGKYDLSKKIKNKLKNGSDLT